MEDQQRFSGVRDQMAFRPNTAEFPPAMAYVPWQHWNRLYDLEKALAYGTIFPELNKPFRGVRGGCR